MINASEALTDTVIALPATITVSVFCVPTLAHVDENDGLPPIVTKAPWSTRDVAFGAVSRFACLAPAAKPVNETEAAARVPVPSK